MPVGNAQSGTGPALRAPQGTDPRYQSHRGSIQAFIRAQELPVNDELILMKLTPASYIGLASKLVDYLDLE